MDNEPLLFVHGPPVFIRVTVTDEESTSVFTPIMEEEQLVADEAEQKRVVNPSVRRRIAYLDGSFQKEVYQPLQFNLGTDSVTGAIDKVDGETVFIELRGEEKEVVAVEMNTIEEILWRGTPFIEKVNN